MTLYDLLDHDWRYYISWEDEMSCQDAGQEAKQADSKVPENYRQFQTVSQATENPYVRLNNQAATIHDLQTRLADLEESNAWQARTLKTNADALINAQNQVKTYQQANQNLLKDLERFHELRRMFLRTVDALVNAEFNR